MSNFVLFKKFELLVLFAAIISLSACQTVRREATLNIAPGVFQPEDMTKNSKGYRWGKAQLITAQSDGRFAQVLFNSMKNNFVLGHQKTLSIFALKRWKWFKDGDFIKGVEGSVSSPLGSIPYLRISAKGRECFYFRLLYQKQGDDSEMRYTKELNGYLCEKPDEKISETLISEFVNQISVTRDIISGPTEKVSSGTEDYSEEADKSICDFALNRTKTAWTEMSAWESYVDEARKRGLTPKKCNRLVQSS